MEVFKGIMEKSKKAKKEYIVLYEEPLGRTVLWTKRFISFINKDNAIEIFNAMKKDKNNRNVRIICPMNLEKLIKLAEKMKE